MVFETLSSHVCGQRDIKNDEVENECFVNATNGEIDLYTC